MLDATSSRPAQRTQLRSTLRAANVPWPYVFFAEVMAPNGELKRCLRRRPAADATASTPIQRLLLPMKVFGIGLNKTGTTTLDACLDTLGYDVKGCDLELTRCAVQGTLAPVFRVADQHDGFQDWPWPLVYQELDARYPDSKFILTTRSDSETWFQSLKQHADRKGPTEYRELVYGHEMPHRKKRRHIEIYEGHNQDVRDYFRGREDDLLEVCWEEGSGWEELCEFLGHEIPDRSFPHAKKSPHWLERSLYEVKMEMKRIFGFRPDD